MANDAFSDYLEAKILNAVLKNTAFGTISAAHVALYTATPNDAGGGTEVSTSGTAYDRVTTSSADWTVGTTGHAENANDLTFPTATADWGTVVAFGILDSGTPGAGNLLFWGPLSVSQTITNGGVAKFVAGQLTIDLD